MKEKNAAHPHCGEKDKHRSDPTLPKQKGSRERLPRRSQKNKKGAPPRPPSRTNKKGSRSRLPCKRLAATYVSTNMRSIIGDDGLNFSVRNGKRWTPSP